MTITAAVGDLGKSVYELLETVFGAVYAIFHGVFSAIAGFVTGLFKLVGDVLGGFADAAGGIGKFLMGNTAVLLIGVVGTLLFIRYTTAGKRVGANKKAQ